MSKHERFTLWMLLVFIDFSTLSYHCLELYRRNLESKKNELNIEGLNDCALYYHGYFFPIGKRMKFRKKCVLLKLFIQVIFYVVFNKKFFYKLNRSYTSQLSLNVTCEMCVWQKYGKYEILK